MAKKKKNSRENEGAALDMTPMIDVVFQLIIFFVVTLKTADSLNPDIQLEYGKNGPEVRAKDFDTPPVVIEVMRYTPTYPDPQKVADNKYLSAAGKTIPGVYYSIGGSILTEKQMRDLLKTIISQRGTNFALHIRADKKAHHGDVRKVMDLCGSLGLWKVSFLAILDDGK